MDPLTILAVAKGSYEAIKTGIKLGKEIKGMFTDVASLMDSAAKLTQIAASPPKPKLFGGKSAEQLAMESYQAKKQANDMLNEVRNAFVSTHGLAAWDWVMAETTRIKKQIKRAEEEAAMEEARRQEELWGNIATYGIVFLIIVGGGMALFTTLVMVSKR